MGTRTFFNQYVDLKGANILTVNYALSSPLFPVECADIY